MSSLMLTRYEHTFEIEFLNCVTNIGTLFYAGKRTQTTCFTDNGEFKTNYIANSNLVRLH